MISPYLVGSVVKKLVGEHGLNVLISRPEAFEEVIASSGREALPKTCYVLSPDAELDAREAPEDDANEPNESRPANHQIDLAGLHAKLFLFEKGWEARLFTGSANATTAAFGLNVEVLVELFGRRKDCGIAFAARIRRRSRTGNSSIAPPGVHASTQPDTGRRSQEGLAEKGRTLGSRAWSGASHRDRPRGGCCAAVGYHIVGGTPRDPAWRGGNSMAGHALPRAAQRIGDCPCRKASRTARPSGSRSSRGCLSRR